MYSLYCFCESGGWWLGLVHMDYNPTESQGKLLTFRYFLQCVTLLLDIKELYMGYSI